MLAVDDAGLGCHGFVADASACPAPLDQGAQGTCSAHAVTQVCASMLRLKYAVVIPEGRMADLMKSTCRSWDGISIPDLCAKWNSTDLEIEDANNEVVYKFRIWCKEVVFAEACDRAQTFRGACSICLVTQMSELHALAAFDFYIPETQLVAVNSWGTREPYLCIGSATYVKGWSITPELISAAVRGIARPIPDKTKYYQWLACNGTQQQQFVHDKARAKAARQALDKYIFDMRDMIAPGGKYGAFIDDAGRQEFVSKLTAMKNWLFDNEDATEATFKYKLDELRKQAAPIGLRWLRSTIPRPSR